MDRLSIAVAIANAQNQMRAVCSGVRPWFGTIRGRILVAFLAMSVITGTLGIYSASGIKRAGVLVAKTYDHSLMSINYARAAAADFAAMQAAFARRSVASDPELRRQIDGRVRALEKTLADDLAIAAERSQSERAVQAAENVKQAVALWSEAHRRLMEGDESSAGWNMIDNHAASVEQQIDLLVNYVAGDGFTYRQSAAATVARDTRLNLIAAVLAVILSGIVAWLLGRRIIGPVAAASEVAERIARGDLDGDIPGGRGDELGTLLTSMSVMRDNIKAMMEREVLQRRSAQARLADALANSREGVLVIDAEGRIALANAQAADFLGTPREPLLGTLFDKHTLPIAGVDNVDTSLRLDNNAYATGETRLADGRWLRISRSASQEGGFIIVCSDISVMKEQKLKLTATNLRLDAALDNMSQGLCLYDTHNQLSVVNRRFCEIFNLPPERIQPGMSFRDVLELSMAAGNHSHKTIADLLAEPEIYAADTHFQELNHGRVVAVAYRPTVDGGWVATYEDVTERRQAEERIVFMARHDALTRLPNRVLLAERIDHAVAQLGRGNRFAVLSLDLDNFKQVNDTLGHPVGDEVLCAVAERLQSCVREVDTVARFGGDEFTIVQQNVEQPEQVTVLARRIIEVLSAPYEIGAHRVTLGVSIGIAMAPDDGVLCDKLLKNADVALYRSKADGRGTWRFFEAEMDARLQSRRKLELDLREALANDEFKVFYQPIYDLKEDRVCGFEALLRWQHPTRGMVMPGEFIPVAEEIGLIAALGDWVVQQACSEAKNWPAHIKIAVNVSPVQFKQGRLLQAVTNALATSQLAAERLELEITESVLLANNSGTLETLHAIRKLGVRVSMDDFGTGYSSLSYLRSFLFDKIKIDQSFIRDMGAVDGSSPIIKAIIDICRSMGMITNAEGVETEEQLAQLRIEGCDEVQGYLFSKPVPRTEIPRLIERLNNRGSAERAPAGRDTFSRMPARLPAA
jgi:diguanylate cyclase (GGDEF)-like protein